MQSTHHENPPFTAIDGAGALAELALDMRSSWNHATDRVWRDLDPVLWQLTHNPWAVLQAVSPAKLRAALADADFCRHVDELLQARRAAAQAPAWFQWAHPRSALTGVAYFSMEFMLSEALPIYSGGLGNVAGDQLKAASDLGVPVTGVGLLYQQGYFRQVIDRRGRQRALYPYNDPGQLPITPLRKADGEWLRLEIELPGQSLWLRTWQVQVGRVRLLLLDSNDPANRATLRGITSELYGGGAELRLQQEMLLGMGGWRLLAALGIRPEVCHLNEGHAAFVVLERARHFMQETGQPFEVALAATRAGNLFTTHTAVDAGFDRFAPGLILQYLGDYARRELGLSARELLALGRANADNDSEPFHTAYLAIHGSGAVNGVSRLHGQVSRQLLAPLFPRWPLDEVPVAHVTNGVHMPTWDSALADAFWTEACGKDRWLGRTESLEQDIRRVSDERLWQLRTDSRQYLVAFVRQRLARQLAAAGASPEAVALAGCMLDGRTLTLGFARRFATYKRPNLLLHDPQRLLRLLNDPERPVQLLIAGKAHPADRAGQAMIQEWARFIDQPQARSRVAFLADYDMRLTKQLVQGVDVWVNTPRRPWEASGTSGMKVLVNGGLNLSELDGWWAEAYDPEVGWALGDGHEHGDDPAWDAAEAEALYALLEREIVPAFYARDERGIAPAWVARMRESMARLTPRYSSNRAVREYTERHYLPAAAAYRERAAGKGAGGADIAGWQDRLAERWDALRFDGVTVDAGPERHRFDARVHLGALDPESVRVEMFAEPGADGVPERHEMHCLQPLPGESGSYLYQASVPAGRPAGHYTARIVPRRDGVAVPLECARIVWQR